MAVAHFIIVRAFHMRTRREPYHELGAPDFDRLQRHYTVDWLAQRLERLGYRVHFAPVAETVA
jgi:hypothetical protein